ncbi:MAG: LacI family DNA-binding transcriptional regulator [bacterium]|nr:LacI family DNA-binding transcriptional regulator [bacterium]
MATLQDIADRLGVSKGTVSKALNGSSDISEALQKTILETAVEMGYTKLRRRTDAEKKLCILIENIEYKEPHQLGYDIILGFRQMAEPAGYTVEVVPVTQDFQRNTPYDVFMLQNHYLGAFVLGFSLPSPWMTDFCTSRTLTVLYDNYISANPNIAHVGIDNTEGIELAVSHLHQLGHKRIGYLSGALGSYVMQVRHKAFFQALRREGLRADPSCAGSSYYITECIDRHLPRLLHSGTTAILCSHDMIANAAMIQCQQMGYRVPEDVSIIGFDDLPICAYTSPPMTTIRQDRIQIGKSGYYALESLRNHVLIGSLQLHAQLIIRNSTGTAPASAHPAASSSSPSGSVPSGSVSLEK